MLSGYFHIILWLDSHCSRWSQFVWNRSDVSTLTALSHIFLIPNWYKLNCMVQNGISRHVIYILSFECLISCHDNEKTFHHQPKTSVMVLNKTTQTMKRMTWLVFWQLLSKWKMMWPHIIVALTSSAGHHCQISIDIRVRIAFTIIQNTGINCKLKLSRRKDYWH